MSCFKHRVGTVIAASAPACATLILLLTAPAALAQTQGGCVDSPEAPTIVLGVAAGFAAWLGWKKHR